MALIVGTELAEALPGTADADEIYGLEGDDTLTGGDGDDTLSGDDGNDSLTGDGGLNYFDGGAGNDTIVDGAFAETVFGGDGNDSIIGGTGYDEVDGGAGDDTILGNEGGDNLFGGDGNDSVDGGEGVDVLDGGDGNDTLIGGGGEDTVNAGAGDDVLVGDANADELHGGSGADLIDGGAGNDRLFGEDGDDTIYGGDGADTIDGGTGRNVLRGGGGDDMITGSRRGTAGTDLNLVDYADATGSVTINFSQNESATGNASVGTDQLFNMDGAIGSDYADTYNVDNLFSGQLGRYNEFEGRGGNDTINGNGFTLASYSQATAAVTVDLSAGTAVGDASVGSDRLGGVNGVRGSAFADTLTGSDNATGTVETFEGMGGNDTINGRGGIDAVVYERSTSGISVDLTAGTASDGLSGTDSLLNIENVVGSAFDDTITGSASANRLEGRAGDDVLSGGAGSDTLDGGEDNDTARFTGARTGVSVNLDSGTASDGLGGVDTLISIENIVGSDFNDTISGDSGDNILDGGAGNDLIRAGSGQDLVTGGRGNDTLIGGDGNDTLDGGDGNDSLDGGGGDDSFAGGAGNDTVRGGAGNDVMTGGSGADVFTGSASDLANDRITDFSAGDIIRITGSVFSTAQIAIQPLPPQQVTLIQVDANRDGVFETQIQLDGIVRGIFSATPGAGYTDITLSRANVSPVVASPLGDLSVNEDATLVIDLSTVFSDADGDPLNLTAILANGRDLPSWMVLDAAAQTLTLTAPGTSDVGHYQLVLTGSDQPGSEAVDNFSITVVHVNHAPVVAADKTVIIRGETVGSSLGITMPTDKDADTLTVKITALPSSVIGAVKLQGGTTVTVGQTISLYDLVNLTYEGNYLQSGDAGKFTYTVDDGHGGTASQTISIIVTPVNHLPSTEADKTLTFANGAAATSLAIPTPTDPDGDALYIAITSVPDPTKGTIRTAAGVLVENFTTLAASELAGLTFTPAAGASGIAGTFSYRLQDNNGGIVTQTVTLVISPANQAPSVVAADASFAVNTAVAASTRFTATDPDGNGTITAYRFGGGNVAAGHAYWTLDGVAQTSPFTVSAADLGRVQMRTGAVAGTETLTVEAYDGALWSPADSFTVTAVGPNVAPTVDVGSVTQTTRGGTIAAADIVTAADKNNAVAWLEFRDDNAGAGSGYFMLRGVVQQAGQIFAVAMSDLNQLVFVGGSANGTDSILVRASDGELYSGWKSITLTTSNSNAAPTVTTQSRVAQAGASISVAELIRTSDPDGNAITRYRFSDNTAGGSTLSVANGAIVTADQLASIRITAGAAAGTDTFTVEVYDGALWSAAGTFTVGVRTAANAAPVVTAPAATVARGQTVAVSTLFSTSDADSDAPLLYEVKLGSGATGGRLVLNGTTLQAGVAYQVNALDLAKLSFIGGTANGIDTLQIRAFDGIDWSATTSLSVTTNSNQKPVVSAYDRVLLYGTGARLVDLISVKDADGDSIKQYRIRYVGNLDSPSYVSLNGLSGSAAKLAPSNDDVIVSAANIASVVIFATQQRGENAFTIEAYDGTSWSDPTRFTVITRRENAAPVVTAEFADVDVAEDVALSTLFEVTDPEMASIQRYQIRDLSTAATSGYLTLDGQRVAAGTVIDIAGTDLSRVHFVGGAVDRALDQISINAYDGTNWSGATPIYVATSESANTAPRVTATSTKVALRSQVLLSSLVKATDADGDTIKYWRITDKNADAKSGALVVNNSTIGQGGTYIISAAEFATATLIGGFEETSDEFLIEAFDGVSSSPAASLILDSKPGNRAPKVTVRESAIIVELSTDGSTVVDDKVLLSSLFDAVDQDGDQITRYQFFDSHVAATSNAIRVNGANAPAAQTIDVLADQLSVTYGVAARDASGNILYGTTDLWWVRAFDGTSWSDWQSFSVTTVGPNNAPTITLTRDTVQLRSGLTSTANFVQGLPLFKFADQDGDAITRVRITDLSNGSGSASLYLGSTQIKQGETIEIQAKDFALIYFVAGTDIGTDQFLIEAYDGKQFGPGATLTVRTRDNNIAPRISTLDAAVMKNGGALPIGPLVTATDADGDTVEKYQFYDSNGSAYSGYLTVNGVRQAAGVTFEVTADKLADPLAVAFIGGQTDRIQDVIYVRAFDGIAWGDWYTFTVSTFDHNTAPVVATTDRLVMTGSQTAVTSLFTASDANGDRILRYRFRDGSTDPNSARIVIDGVKQAQNQIIEVSAADLSKVTVLAGSTNFSETFTVQVFDGQSWSNESTFNLTARSTANQAPQVTVPSASVTINGAATAKLLTDLFSATDADGDPIQSYQIMDNNAAGNSGYLEFEGQRQAAGTTLTLMAAELSNARFISGTVNTSDTLMVRAYDGYGYGDWQQVAIKTLA